MDLATTWLIIECLEAPPVAAAAVEPARAALVEAFLAHIHADAARTALRHARELQLENPMTTSGEHRRVDLLIAREHARLR